MPEPEEELVPQHPDVQYEHSDINPRGVIITGYAVFAVCMAFVCLIYFYFVFLSNYRARSSPPALAMEAHGTPLPPQPRIQSSPRRDLEDLLKYENSVLENYSWVDKKNGMVGIPIERAMALIVQRGIPPQQAPADLKLFPPEAGDRGVGFEGKVGPEPR